MTKEGEQLYLRNVVGKWLSPMSVQIQILLHSQRQHQARAQDKVTDSSAPIFIHLYSSRLRTARSSTTEGKLP
jgi:hypothetical protein